MTQRKGTNHHKFTQSRYRTAFPSPASTDSSLEQTAKGPQQYQLPFSCEIYTDVAHHIGAERGNICCYFRKEVGD